MVKGESFIFLCPYTLLGCVRSNRDLRYEKFIIWSTRQGHTHLFSPRPPVVYERDA